MTFAGYVALYVCIFTSLTCAIAVVYQSRMINRLTQDNRMLITSIHSLFIEAVWPPHDIE